MVKKYKSKTCLSINVVLEGGGNAHISFQPLTEGGSVYYTEDEVLQKAIESHRYYRNGFTAEEVKDEEPAPAPVEEEEPESNVVAVASLDEAKDYLSDKYGVSRTKMKGVDGVKSAAAKYGVVFEGI